MSHGKKDTSSVMIDPMQLSELRVNLSQVETVTQANTKN